MAAFAGPTAAVMRRSPLPSLAAPRRPSAGGAGSQL